MFTTHPFDRLVKPDALWATGRLRAALSFLEAHYGKNSAT